MVFTSLLESAAHALEFFYTWPAIVLFLLEVWRHNPITATRSSQELDSNAPSLDLDSSMLYSSLRKTVSDEDFNGWSQPGGKGFMVRSQTYNEDSLKVCITSLYPLFIFSSSPEKFFVLLNQPLEHTSWTYILMYYFISTWGLRICPHITLSLPVQNSAEKLVDGDQVSGGEPLLKLLALDWLKSDLRIDHIALQSTCCVQVS